jgi:hypothetical protein
VAQGPEALALRKGFVVPRRRASWTRLALEGARPLATVSGSTYHTSMGWGVPGQSLQSATAGRFNDVTHECQGGKRHTTHVTQRRNDDVCDEKNAFGKDLSWWLSPTMHDPSNSSHS